MKTKQWLIAGAIVVAKTLVVGAIVVGERVLREMSTDVAKSIITDFKSAKYLAENKKQA